MSIILAGIGGMVVGLCFPPPNKIKFWIGILGFTLALIAQHI